MTDHPEKTRLVLSLQQHYSMRKSAKPKTTKKHNDSILDHHVIFLDYDFKVHFLDALR